MARSARRRSTPLSPAKSREAPTPQRQTRRSTRTQSHESDNLLARNTRRQRPQLESVVEQEDTIVARYPSDAVQKSDTSASNAADDVERSSEPPDSAVSSDDEVPLNLDHELIIESLVWISQDADELLAQVKKLSTDQLAIGLQNPGSAISRRIYRAAQRLRDSTEPCGKTSFLPIRALSGLLTNRGLPSVGACRVFMKANLARFMLALLNVKAAENDLSCHDCLQRLTLDRFPEPFVLALLRQYTESSLSSEEFEHKTSSLGISILTQLYISEASVRASENDDSDPELLLQQIFTDGDGGYQNLSLGADPDPEAGGYGSAIEQRLRELRRFVSSDALQILDLRALKMKYTRKAFLEQAAAWVLQRAMQLHEAIESEGGVSAISDILEAGPQSPTPKLEKLDKSTRRSREEKALEEGTSFLREMDEELDAAEEDESSVEDEDESDVEEDIIEHEQEPEVDEPAATNPEHQAVIPESPHADQAQSAVLAEHADEAKAQSQAEADNVLGNDEQVEQDIPDSAQQPPDWMTRPTQETLAILSVTERQQKESNKENCPKQRYGLLDRQPDAQRFNFDDDDSQPQTQNNGKRPHREEGDSEEEDDFETDTRQSKRPRHQQQNGKVARRIPRTIEERSESDMFVNDSEEPEVRVQSRTSSQPVARRSAARAARAGPSSTQPPPRRAASATASSRHESLSVSASAPPPSTYAGYQVINTQAKANSRFATLVASTSNHRPPQVRRPWAEGELTRLMELMEVYGTSWARIKQADEQTTTPLLVNRTQVQLKDKARNMKLDFLKAEQPLPEYLVGVTISKSHKEQLRAKGIAVPGDDQEE